MLILSGAETAISKSGRLLALSDSLIAAWTFGFNAEDGDAFSVYGNVVSASALSRVELLSESTAYPPQFSNGEPEVHPIAALHAEGAGVFTVGYRQDYRWAARHDPEEELRVFREVLSRVR